MNTEAKCSFISLEPTDTVSTGHVFGESRKSSHEGTRSLAISMRVTEM